MSLRPRPGHPNGSSPVIVRGSPFTFRTLHPLDGALPRNAPHRAGDWRESTLDQTQTFTMPFVAGLLHQEPMSCEVVL